MKSIIVLFIIITITGTTYAQDAEVWKEPVKESRDYHEFRTKVSKPPYGLAKVQAFIAGNKTDENDQIIIDQQKYRSLSLREQFTYHMITGETYAQICDAMPPIQNEHLKIFGQLSNFLGDTEWSQRQLTFMISNKDSVMVFIKESADRSGRIGVNYKQAIVEMNARQMIPFLIKMYHKDRKDHDILTVLMLLMKNGKYAPFVASQSYEKLYGTKSDYQSFLALNKANEDLIIKRATEYYGSIK